MANKRFMAVLLAGLLAMAVAREAIAWQVTELTSSNETEITIQLRIWQDVSNADRLWLSARAPGDHWGAFGTIPLTTELRGYYEEKREFWMAEATIAEVGLRIWQRKLEPDRIWVQTCASPCNGLERGHRVDDWVPLGKNEMPLDDGLSTSGRYRYGDTTTTVPRGNPGLLEDREHLLALRDVFRAEPPLDWEAATPTSHWEGVTLGGTPPRVQGLNLSNRGLAGEIWGYLGDLTGVAVPQFGRQRVDRNAALQDAISESAAAPAAEGQSVGRLLGSRPMAGDRTRSHFTRSARVLQAKRRVSNFPILRM